MAQTFEDFVKQIELIKSSEAKLYQFLEQMPVGVFIIDKNYHIVFSNHRSNEILGWTNIQNQDFTSIKNFIGIQNSSSYDEFSFHELPIVRSLNGEKVISENVAITNSKGECFKLRILSTPIILNNKIEYALAIFDTIPLSHEEILSNILHFDFLSHNYSNFTKFLTHLICKSLNITRVGFWVNENNYIECLNIYDSLKNEHQKGMKILKKDFPVYFSYISKGVVIPSEDAMNHEATRELAAIYLEPNQVKSTLDCPIFVHNQLYGIYCCEVSLYKRKWKDSEIHLIQSISKLTGLLIEKYYYQS